MGKGSPWRSDKDNNHFIPNGKVSHGMNSKKANDVRRKTEKALKSSGKKAVVEEEPIGNLSGLERKIAEEKVGAKIIRAMEGQTGTNLFEFDNGEEYYVFNSADDAEKEAVEQVKQDVESEPEIFSQDFLQQHMTISETDRRIIAGEEADNAVEDRNRSELEDMAKDHNIDFDDDIDTDDLKEKVRDAISDDVEERLEDPVKYFVDDQGIYSREDLLKQNFIRIDAEDAAQDAVDTDGIPHFLARYDGDEVTVSKNGTTLFMYRTN